MCRYIVAICNLKLSSSGYTDTRIATSTNANASSVESYSDCDAMCVLFVVGHNHRREKIEVYMIEK